MLAEDELNELAADMKANGLIHPLVVKEGVLIDGRNRREACRIAGVPVSTRRSAPHPAWRRGMPKMEWATEIGCP